MTDMPKPGTSGSYSLFRTVRFRLTAFFCAVATILAVLAAVLLFNSLADAYRHELRARARFLSRDLAVNAAPSMVGGDKMQLSVLVNTLLEKTEVVSTAIVDHTGQVVMHSDLTQMGKPYTGPEPQNGGTEEEGLLVAGRPIYFDGKEAGRVVLVMDASLVETRISRLMIQVIIGTLLTILAACFIFYKFITHFVAPIGRLTAAAGRVSRGDLSVRVPVEGGAEVESLARGFNRMTESLAQSQVKLQMGYLQAVEALAAAVEAKDPYTRGHCERVAHYAEVIARRMGLSPAQIEELKLAGRLHDLGKIGVPEKILGKRGPLLPEEARTMEDHPRIAGEILAPAEFLADVREIVMGHHERYDGNGYPNQTRGEAIIISCRILALADAFDAMTSGRPYSAGMEPELAVAAIREERGAQFDPRVVDAFLEVWREFDLDRAREERERDIPWAPERERLEYLTSHWYQPDQAKTGGGQ